MKASPPAGVQKINCASLFCAEAVKHEFSTVSSAGFTISVCVHPGLLWRVLSLGALRKEHSHHDSGFTHSGGRAVQAV